MFEVWSLSGHSRGHAKEFAAPAAELSEVAAGRGEGLGVRSGQILFILDVAIECH